VRFFLKANIALFYGTEGVPSICFPLCLHGLCPSWYVPLGHHRCLRCRWDPSRPPCHLHPRASVSWNIITSFLSPPLAASPSLFISPTIGVLASSPLSRPVLGLIRGRFIWIGSPLGGSSPWLGLHLPLPLSQVPHLPSPPLHFALSPTPQLRLLQLWASTRHFVFYCWLDNLAITSDSTVSFTFLPLATTFYQSFGRLECFSSARSFQLQTTLCTVLPLGCMRHWRPYEPPPARHHCHRHPRLQRCLSGRILM
jgi:hypothetical protein